MTNIFNELWQFSLTLLSYISSAWDFLTDNIVIDISWLKIPLFAPDGIYIDMGFSVFGFLGVSLLSFLAFKVIKAVVPFL